VRNFAQVEALTLIEINFEDTKELISAFSSNDPIKILQNLEVAIGTHIDSARSLLFLDEMQVVPELYAKLRWFAEKMPELPVIAAGSLLEFMLLKAKTPLSMPVGRIEFMYLEPLSFEEFLLALKKQHLINIIHTVTFNEDIPQFAHDQLMRYVNEYALVGGMPAAVDVWVQTGSFLEVSKIQQNILASYTGDFHKYVGRADQDLLEKTMHQIPLSLGNKFVYSKVTREAQAASIKHALDLLCKARICNKVVSTDANGVPLGAEKNEKFFKVNFLDVGLCSAQLKLSLKAITVDNELSLVNAGGIAEQMTGQLLRTLDPLFIDPEMYYWNRHDAGADAEVDYVIQHVSQVIPVEVKAGKPGSLKSLHLFMQYKKRQSAVRVYSGLPTKSMVAYKNKDGEIIRYELRSIPFYLVSELHRLLN